jgi:hypothetical protein
VANHLNCQLVTFEEEPLQLWRQAKLFARAGAIERNMRKYQRAETLHFIFITVARMTKLRKMKKKVQT